MSIPVQVRLYAGGSAIVQIDKIPDKCPQCHYHIMPLQLGGVSPESSMPGHASTPKQASVLFQCTRKGCQRAFLGQYDSPIPTAIDTGEVFLLVGVAPTTAQSIEYGAIIQKISPTFVEIMNQVEAAKAADLTQLVGIGFRKALEFLIKDFAKKKNPTKVDVIEKSKLGGVIESFIDHPQLKAMAKRTAWLGNDETHYLRKWETKDVEDLEKLVGLTKAWVQHVELSNQYEIDMSDEKPRTE
jgi:Domain of unknown function (DUF4145)